MLFEGGGRASEKKQQSFGNNSGKPQPIRTKFGRYEQIKGNIGCGQNWTSFYFCHMTFRQFPNSRFIPNFATTLEFMSPRNESKTNEMEIFHLRIICTQKP